MTSKVVDEDRFSARTVDVCVRTHVGTRHTEILTWTVVWDNLVGAVRTHFLTESGERAAPYSILVAH